MNNKTDGAHRVSHKKNCFKIKKKLANYKYKIK